MTDPFADDLLARLDALGVMRAKRMFGGIGLYCDERFFGLIADGELYFKVDAATVERYRGADSHPFQPFRHKPPMGGYWSVPPGVLDHDARLVEWARLAVATAKAAGSGRKGAKSKPAKRARRT